MTQAVAEFPTSVPTGKFRPPAIRCTWAPNIPSVEKNASFRLRMFRPELLLHALNATSIPDEQPARLPGGKKKIVSIIRTTLFRVI